MKKHRPLILGFLAIGAALGAWNVEAYTDIAYVCEYTASTRGYRLWAMGLQSGSWEKRSALEAYVAAEDPAKVRHRWTRYAGTGKNVFGYSQSFGHASPAGAIFLKNEVLSAWMKGRSRAEILDLYNFLQTAPHDISLDRGYEIMQTARAQGK